MKKTHLWWGITVMVGLITVLSFLIPAYAASQKITIMVKDKDDIGRWQVAVERASQADPALKDFTIVYETPPDVNVAFFAEFGANDAPDIVSIDSFEVPSWAEAKYLYDITDKVEAWDDWAQYPTSLQEIVKDRGRVYALLKQTDVRIIFLRKDLLPYALGSQWQPLSWEELLSMARSLKAAGMKYPLAIQSGPNWGESTAMQAFLPLLYGAGGVLYDQEKGKWVVSSNAYMDVLNFYETIYKEGLANPDVPTVASPWMTARGDFQAGRTAILFDGQWAWGAFKSGGSLEVPNADCNVGFIKIPGKNGGFSTFSGGFAWAIANKGLDIPPAHPKEAFELIAAYCSQKGIAEHAVETNSVAPRLDAVKVPEYAQNKYLSWCTAEVLPYTHYRPALPEYPQVSEQIRLLVKQVATLQMTPKEALSEYAKAVAKIVGSDNVIDELGLLK